MNPLLEHAGRARHEALSFLFFAVLVATTFVV